MNKLLLSALSLLLLGVLFACEKEAFTHKEDDTPLNAHELTVALNTSLSALSEDLILRNARPIPGVRYELLERPSEPITGEAEYLSYLKKADLQVTTIKVRNFHDVLEKIRQAITSGRLTPEDIQTGFQNNMHLQIPPIKGLEEFSQQDQPLAALNAEDDGCYMCCIRDHDNRREDIDKDLLICMGSIGWTNPEAGWVCLSNASIDLIDSYRKLNNCLATVTQTTY